MASLNEKVTELVPNLSEPLLQVAAAIDTLRFGVIQLTVHEGKLVQLEITEKRRFT
ncbi:YezD family protein [Qipengyuania qiaonensis]|uniref:YezD family protein n=1 Tax=Qipengyuania qiaonensis TaxID=2867240 RepID=A0ABS7J4D3_9SPHN|nr:YezD family protein [Qipengyuania qiaonensis]MBX7482147.1 YezD family protein [Qipengyuania qiaonensis]